MKNVLLVMILVVALASAAPQIVNSFPAPATGLVGLAYGENYLWALTSSRYIYKLDPATGAVQSSFLISPAIASPDGIGYCGTLLYVTAGTATVYKYTTSGSLSGTTVLWCDG